MERVGLVVHSKKLMKSLIEGLSNEYIHISIQSEDSLQFLKLLSTQRNLPTIILIEINMPKMDGLSVSYFLKHHYPQVKTICITEKENEEVITFLQNIGVSVFINKKDTSISKIKKVIDTVTQGEIYCDHSLNIHLTKKEITNISMNDFVSEKMNLTRKEILFLQLCVSSISYDEIATLMNVGKHTIYNYQKSIKEKIGLSSRVEFLIFAIQHGLGKVAQIV